MEMEKGLWTNVFSPVKALMFCGNSRHIVECFSSQSAVLINDKAFQRKPQEAVMGRRDVVTVE